MIYQKADYSKLISRLEQLPTGKIPMILDTDAYNEIDDQFALCYMLSSPERLDVKGICAAPFYNAKSTSAGDGEEKSYDEIIRILNLANRQELISNTYHGSGEFLTDTQTPIKSDAAEFIVKTANQMQDGQQLYVVAIGAITNVASAILIDPSIIDKIVVIWLGGHDINWVDNWEFNCFQDTKAASVVFDCGVPLVQAPCSGVVSHLSTTEPELRERLKGKGKLSDYLYDICIDFARFYNLPYGWSKVLWDMATIAYLCNPNFVSTKYISSPIVINPGTYSFDDRRHPICYIYGINRDEIFNDFFNKMERYK